MFQLMFQCRELGKEVAVVEKSLNSVEKTGNDSRAHFFRTKGRMPSMPRDFFPLFLTGEPRCERGDETLRTQNLKMV